MDSDAHRRLLAGDESALGEVYDRFGAIVFGLALRVVRDRAAAEDITQDVFVTLWQRPDSFVPQRGSLKSWLCTIAHRRAVDWVRRAESQRRRQQQEHLLPKHEETVESVVIDASERHQVRTMLSELPSDQREAIRLAYFEGYTYRQVAERLGIAEGTSKSRIRLGLQSLAEAMQPEKVDA